MSDCSAIRDRAMLTDAIQAATRPASGAYDAAPADGSEKSLVIAFSILHGIVNEYLDGGDQLVEGCDCGEHVEAPAASVPPPMKRRVVIDIYDHTSGAEIVELLADLRGLGVDAHVEAVPA